MGFANRIITSLVPRDVMASLLATHPPSAFSASEGYAKEAETALRNEPEGKVNDDGAHPKRAGSDLDIRRGNRGYQRISDLAESRASCAFRCGFVNRIIAVQVYQGPVGIVILAIVLGLLVFNGRDFFNPRGPTSK